VAEAKAATRPGPPADPATTDTAAVTRGPDIRSSMGSGPRWDFFAALPGVVDASRALRKIKSVNRESAVAALASVFAAQKDLTDEQRRALLGKAVAAIPAPIRDDLAARTLWLERWFDAEMERLGQAYRSRIRWFTAVAALLLVGALGLDAIDISTQLYKEPDRRQVLVAAAEAEVADPSAEACTTPSTSAPATGDEPQPVAEVRDRLTCARNLVADIEGFQVGRWTPTDHGWDHMPPKWGERLIAILGMAISVIAFTAGAPWWFSVLKKLMDARKALTGKA
jgi:hypothetical protein